MYIDGSCHCGAVSFSAEIDPGRVVVCHCTDCQSLSGSAFRVLVPAPIGGFSVQGTTKSYVKIAESGSRRAQVFCPECGTPLWSAAPEDPPVVNIRLGSVTQRAELRPRAQLWQRSAMPWLAELSTIPGWEKQP